MVGNDTFGQAPAQTLDREFEVQCAERRRDCERTLADFVDGMALRNARARMSDLAALPAIGRGRDYSPMKEKRRAR